MRSARISIARLPALEIRSSACSIKRQSILRSEKGQSFGNGYFARGTAVLSDVPVPNLDATGNPVHAAAISITQYVRQMLVVEAKLQASSALAATVAYRPRELTRARSRSSSIRYGAFPGRSIASFSRAIQFHNSLHLNCSSCDRCTDPFEVAIRLALLGPAVQRPGQHQSIFWLCNGAMRIVRLELSLLRGQALIHT